MSVLFAILVVAGAIAYRVTTPEERARIVTKVRDFTEPVRAEALRGRTATAPFRDALRARTRWVVVTPTILGLNAVMFLRMMLSGDPIGAPDTLVAFGGSFGPQTTNGEWWRLITAMFVHASALHLLANLIGMLKVGFLLERLVGPVMFTCVFFTAGLSAGVANLAEHPLAVHVGASGAIFGLYGLFAAVTIWSFVRQSGLRIPVMVFQGQALGAAVFLLYNAATTGLMSAPNMAAFLVGLVAGLLLAKDVGERQPSIKPVAIATAAAFGVIIYLALPYRGLVDVRPTIAEIMTIEDRTTPPYMRAVDRLTTGRSNFNALAGHINGKIRPELQAAHARVEALKGVRHDEHRRLVDDAEEYLRLRETSWRLRAEGLQKGSTQTLREADRTEHASLAALRRLKAIRLTPDVRT